MSVPAEKKWRSEARDAGTKTAQPSPAPGARAGGFPALGGGGRGVGDGRRTLGVVRPFNPISWFHPRGIYRVLARLEPRLPDVSRCLFLTFTIDPQLFADPAAAFEHGRDRVRRIFYRLRRGVRWEGRVHRIGEPYCVKVEFHANGWAHFHVVFLTRRFLPAALVADLWGLGRTNVQRITNEDFRYLLKYVTKDAGELPAWVCSRNRLRVFQSARGFLKPIPKRSKPTPTGVPEKRRTSGETLGERIERYRRTALFEAGGKFSQLPLGAPFGEVHAEEILPAALAGRYLGGGHYIINDHKELEIWKRHRQQGNKLR